MLKKIFVKKKKQQKKNLKPKCLITKTKAHVKSGTPFFFFLNYNRMVIND